MAGRDITEGRASNAIAVDLGIVTGTSLWQNTDIAYDVALGGIPFVLATTDSRPYLRGTAPFKKDQFDNGTEAGEQSLTGWWLRSQSSFHNGAGIKFYDTTSGEALNYRFAQSENVNVWNKGQVTLLRKTNVVGYPATGLEADSKAPSHCDSIKWTISGTTYQGSLLAGAYNIVRVTDTGSIQPLFAPSGTQDRLYATATDGTYAYFIVNEVSGSLKMHVYKKALSAAAADPATLMFNDSTVVASAELAYVKERLVMTINNKVYELSTSAVALPTPIYTHPTTTYTWSAIAASGAAIYVSGWNGAQSSIVKFTLGSSGTLPTLTSAVVAAEMPTGERIYAMKYYLGFMMIGTNKGVRAAIVTDDGSINYGPLIVETVQPVYDFTARQNYVWCASGTTTGKQGLIRIDLGAEVDTLRFAYANDLQIDSPVDGGLTVAVCHLGETDRIIFGNCSSQGRVTTSITYKQLTSNVATLTTSAPHNYIVGQAVFVTGVGAPFDSAAGFPVGSQKIITDVTPTTFSYAVTNTDIALTAVSPAGTVFAAGTLVVESATELAPTGYLTTGRIRFGVLEPKNFKRLLGRGDFTYGSATMQTVDKAGRVYDHISYDSSVPSAEVATTQPEGAQEYVSYKFSLYRDGTTPSLGPVFEGYQAKATIATPRQRLIRFYVYCMDVETDRYNVQFGYTGRGFEQMLALENMEESGDVVMLQDLNTGENRQVQIEGVQLSNLTPPDKGTSNFGGIVEVTVRTV